jgi:hypothetical protein
MEHSFAGSGVELEPELPPSDASLFVAGAGGQLVVFPLVDRGVVRIGRGESCELRLADTRVSRVHATIEAVGGHHLISDLGSANGTSINGLRIPRQSVFSLREGDEIVIGYTHLIYGHAGDLVAEPCGELGPSPDRSYPIVDLLQAGAREADDSAQADLLRAFSGVSRATGLQRSLELIARRLVVDTVAIFVPEGVHGIDLAAVYPAHPQADRLAEVARPIMASERGRLVRSRIATSPHGLSETQEVDSSSSAAVSLSQGTRPVGVLAVERLRGRSLERSDLVRLAVLGERLATTLALHDADEGDTRLGVDD